MQTKTRSPNQALGPHSTAPAAERAYLVAVETRGGRDGLGAEASLDELALLARTAGAEVAGRAIQRLRTPNPATYIGKGKLEEIVAEREAAGYTLVLFDDELSPSQQRNLEKALAVKVLDRTALIIDIFARRAQTREARLQVELAQSQYLLPRLAGQWSHLERLEGRIGTRGPGETQIETDRRLVRNRITRLRREIESVRQQRALHRRRRSRQGMQVVALVGYTNAGKSTLMHALSGADVLTEDLLFATLDPVTRRIRLPSGADALLSDTVGFIQKLPTHLVAAFRATLEELADADVLVHLVDVTHPDAAEQHATVERTLADLGLADKPRVVAFNKVDLLAGPQGQPGALEDIERSLLAQEPGNPFVLSLPVLSPAEGSKGAPPDQKAWFDKLTTNVSGTQQGVLISAARRWNLEALLKAIERELQAVRAAGRATA